VARIRRHPRAIAAALLGLVALVYAPALAQDQDAKDKTDLYDRPVLAIDPGMHTASIQAQAVDAAGRFAVTGGDDRTVRVWSLLEHKLLRTIWVPVGPANVGDVRAVAISPDGKTIAVGGRTERLRGDHAIYLFDRESGNLVVRIHGDLPDVSESLTFSHDGRYLAATLGGKNGVRIFDRDKDWSETFRDDAYGDFSHGAAFAPEGRLATTSDDGVVRLYQFNPDSDDPNFHLVTQVSVPPGYNPRGVAFNPNGKLLAVGYRDVATVDILDGATLSHVDNESPTDAKPNPAGFAEVVWSRNGTTLLAAGAVVDARDRLLLFAWDKVGLAERRMTYCKSTMAAGVDALPGERVLVAGMTPCLDLMDSDGNPIWAVASPVLDLRWQTDEMLVSEDGEVVDFGYDFPGTAALRFDVRSLTLSGLPRNDGSTFAPNRNGLTLDHWRNETNPSLGGQQLPLRSRERARSLAIAPGGKLFFLGSSDALAAFDDARSLKWRIESRNTIWAVNASGDGRVVVSAESDGAIHWRRAEDGRELLAL
jgi:WD40 repeat protein